MGNWFKSPWLYLGTGICVFVFGIIVVIAGVLFNVLGNQAIDNGIKESLVISDSEAANMDPDSRWQSNVYMEDPDDERVPLYRNFSLWNLTNPAEALLGSQPVFEEVGTYFYRQRIIKNDPDFSDGTVSYNLTREYLFEPSLSTSDPTQDIIYNINPSYGAVIQGAGSEERLVTVVGGRTVTGYLEALNTVFTDLTIANVFPPTLTQVENGQASALGGFDMFYVRWANATSSNDPLSDPSTRLSLDTSSGLSLAITQQLFDEAGDFSLTNLNSTFVGVWFAIEQNADPTANTTIQSVFGLDAMQLDMIIQFRARFNQNITIPNIIPMTFGVSATEIGITQWATGNISGGVSAQTLLPGFPSVPEYAIWATNTNATTANFVPSDAQNFLFDVTLPLTTDLGFLTFAAFLAANDSVNINSRWGLDLQQSQDLFNYFFSAGLATVQTTFGPLGTIGVSGLIVAKTAEQALFTYVDPLLQLVAPTDPNIDPQGYFTNITADVARVTERSLLYTGSTDIDLISQYILYQGSDTQNGWAAPVPVQGSEEFAGQSAPFRSRNDVYEIWSGDLARTVQFLYDEDVEIFDIEVWRHRLNASQLEPDPLFFQTLNGFANLTSIVKAPVFLSKRGQLDVPEEVRSRVVQRPVNPEIDDTFLDLEPNTGLVFNVDYRLQINVYVPDRANETLYNIFHPGIYNGDSYWPIAVADQNAIITEGLANKFKNRVIEPMETVETSFIVLIAVGSFFAFLGLICCGFSLGLFLYQEKGGFSGYEGEL